MEAESNQEADILARIEGGEMLTAIAESIGESRSSLLRWLNADPARSARAREARIAAAAAWDEKAERGIELASSALDLAKAKELAHHYRWRASKIAPKDYGDRLSTEITGKDGGPVQTEDMTPNEVARRIAFALAQGLQQKKEP